jgi:hypothetical protein
MNQNKKLQAALDKAIKALNEAHAIAQAEVPGAGLYLEAGGSLFAMRPEPGSFRGRDPSMRERQELIFATANGTTLCDCGAW